MSVQELTLPLGSRSTLISTKAPGALGMLLAPCLCISWFFHAPVPDAPKANQLAASLFGVLYLSGALASAVAMRRLRATGSGKGAAILFAIQVVGLLLAMNFDTIEYVAPHLRNSQVFFITDMAYPFSHVLMVIVGIAVVKAGVLRGWRRIPAFIIGLALPLFFASSAVFGRGNRGWIFIGGVTLGWFLLGLAVFTSAPPHPNQATTS